MNNRREKPTRYAVFAAIAPWDTISMPSPVKVVRPSSGETLLKIR